jgi:hypothetical protein
MEELDDFRSETPQAHYHYIDGVLRITLKHDLIIDHRTAEKIEHFRMEMTRGYSIPVMLVIPIDYLLLDPTAFRYFTSEEGMIGCQAKALVLKAPLRVLLTNFSLFFEKSNQPARIFTNRKEAMMWLFKVAVRPTLSENELLSAE